MLLASLVANVAHQHLLVGEAAGKLLSIGKLTTTIASDVKYHAIAQTQPGYHVTEVALPYAIRETLVDHIGYVVRQDGVAEPTADVIVCAQILVPELSVQVLGVVLFPRPVPAQIEACGDVHMPISELGKHLAKHLKELHARHLGIELLAVLGTHLLPTDAKLLLLVGEEAIALVNQLPQGIQIALRRGIIRIVTLLARE